MRQNVIVQLSEDRILGDLPDGSTQTGSFREVQDRVHSKETAAHLYITRLSLREAMKHLHEHSNDQYLNISIFMTNRSVETCQHATC